MSPSERQLLGPPRPSRSLLRRPVSTEQHIDPEVLDAAHEAWDAVYFAEFDAMEAALKAADEKRRELAQADPEGQEYAYRICRERISGRIIREKRRFRTEGEARYWANAHLMPVWWVERALLGTWEKLD